jgi:hypothetical protein
MENMIAFPFQRGKLYPVGHLDQFLASLVEARQRDPKLSAAERARSLPWAKLWWEELYPIKLFVAYHQLPGDTEFQIKPNGDPVDVELHSSSANTRFQITLAYPDWDASGEQSRNPGYIASLERAGANQERPVFLGGQITKASAGQIASDPRARSYETDQAACEAGLRKALEDKFCKAARYTGKVDVLLVYFSRLRFHTNYGEIASVVVPVIAEELQKLGQSPFRRIVIIDDDPLAYAEYP